MNQLKTWAWALSLAFCLCLPSKAQVITHPITDDGYSNVPLQFPFPFYGQTFTNSWMYDNGVVSFIDPTQPGALSQWAWSATPLSQAPGNYFIAPLWADLAPVPGTTTYTTQGTTQYQRYNWNNLAEYYSINSGTGLRLNTFSLEIKPDGTFNTTYSAVNLSSSTISIGSVGNVSAGEYNQIQYYNNGTQVTSIPNWSSSTYAPPQTDPCSMNPQSNPTCPGYINQQPEPQTFQQITKQTTTIDTTQTDFTRTDVGGVIIDSTGQISAPTGIPDSTRESVKAAIEQSTIENNPVKLKPRIGVIVRDAIENRIALAVVRESIESSTEYSGTSMDAGTGILITRITVLAEEERKENNRRVNPNDATNPLNATAANLIQEDKPNTGPSVRNGGSVDGMSGTISIASLTSSISLDSYQKMQMKDARFYAPKEIYKGQQTVDNRNASRGLFGANDARHAEMVNQQYQIGN